MDKPGRILVVDDDPTNRLVLTRSLEKVGYSLLTAEDGIKAVEIATRQLPDLILLDFVMPGRNGLEVCTILKGQDATAAIPIIFVTAVSETDRILKAFSAGGCDYVTRPFTTEELLARVSVHIRLRRTEEELRHKNKEMEELTHELAEANVELARLSRIDPLTELFNRRTWEEVMVEEHQRFRRHNCPYSIVMIDVDSFKAFNDTRGHQAGDECLRRIAQAIDEACRRIDTVGRYGGEEFVVLAPETHGDGAVKLAERIRKAIWALAIPHPASANADRVTVSLGVATSAHGSWESILKRADDALYVAKRAGRNMVYGDHRTPSELAAADDAGEPVAPGSPSAEATGAPLRVLVVDDDSTNRALFKGCLTRSGYTVHEAVDGEAAIAYASDDPPDVIIMDVMMPGMDGLECTRRVKADPDTRDIPVIMVSALDDGADIVSGLEAGADEYVTKPIRTAELTLRVRSMARLYRERRDLFRSYEVRGEHMRVLARLVEFCRGIGTSARVDEVLERTLSTVEDIADSSRIAIMLPDRGEKRLQIAASKGVDDELAATIKVPVGSPIAGQVFASGKTLVIKSGSVVGTNSEIYDSRFFVDTPLISVPLGASGRVVGVLNVTGRRGGRSIQPQEVEYIELVGKIAAGAIDGILTRQARDKASDSVMVALAKLAEHRDNDTGLHLDRVTRFCRILADELRKTDRFSCAIDEVFLHDLVRAMPLHDIGKVAVPDQILLHPGKLSEEQMTVMRTHAAIGAQTIKSLVERTPGAGFLRMAAEIAHYHHEWYDGSGYPLRLKGDEIPLAARIAALADVYDALTTRRVYKEAIAHDRAVAIIVEGAGTQFDPAVVEAFTHRESEFAGLALSMADDEPEAAVISAGYSTS